jgi:peptidoglycan/LPS O-acetylase OafA/YrhL
VIVLDIVWGLVTGLAAWLPSWLIGRGRRWAAALDVLAVFAALFVYWEVIDPHPPRFTSRVLAFMVAALVAVGCGYVLRRRQSGYVASTR